VIEIRSKSATLRQNSTWLAPVWCLIFHMHMRRNILLKKEYYRAGKQIAVSFPAGK
jgi:hypothetical protein